MSIAVGTLTVPAAPGDVSVTGLPFQPKTVFFYGTSIDIPQTIDPTLDFMICRGAMNSTGEQFATCSFVLGAATPTRAYSKRTSLCYVLRIGAGTVVEASYVSMNSDGFTINFGLTDTIARTVGYMAFDTTSRISEAQIPATPSTQITIQPSGVPDFLMLCGDGSNAAGSDDGSTVEGFTWNVGSTADAGLRGLTYQSQAWGVTGTLCGGASRVTALRKIAGTSATFLSTSSQLTGSALLTTPTTASAAFYAELLALAGYEVYVQQITTPTSTGDVSYNQSGFTPEGVMVLGAGAAAGPGVSAFTRLIFGMTDGTHQYSWYSRAIRSTILGVLATRTYQVGTDTALYYSDSDASGGLNIVGVLKSFDTAGFTVTWDPVGVSAIVLQAVSFRRKPTGLAWPVHHLAGIP